MNGKQIGGLVAALVILVVTALSGIGISYLANNLSNIVSDTTAAVSAPNEDYIGVVTISGTLGETANDLTSLLSLETYNTKYIIDRIYDFANDKNNKGILLYVDSPGGYVFDADLIYQELAYYKQQTGKPIYSYYASLAASGAYYVSALSDRIYAERTCQIGSIGVVIEITDTTKMEEDLGIKRIPITSGKNKTLNFVNGDLVPEQRAMYQEIVDDAYNTFVDIVVNGRGLPREKVLELADGSVFTARKSLELGLIDVVGTYSDAVAGLSDAIGNKNIKLYSPTPSDSFFTSLFAAISGENKAKSESEVLIDFIEESRKGELMYYAV